MPQTQDPRQREAWQRNAILRGVPDASDDDLVLISNVDEIPRAATVQQMARDTVSPIFGLRLAFYCLFVNYRNIEGPESGIVCTVATRRVEFGRVAPHDLRDAVRHDRVLASVLSDAGWHFSYLVDESAVRRKLAARSLQESNNEGFVRSFDIFDIVRHRRDPFRRPGLRWEIVDPKELPSWLQANHRALSRLYCPRTHVERIARRVATNFTRLLPTSRRIPKTSPVIICPYLHGHEAVEIAAKFGLDRPHGRKLDFFLWQDTRGLGPERAYEHCWQQFPERDIVILHSDMAPMPDDASNRWYDMLLHYRNKLPRAGMLACNLFYPASRPGESRRVQCAGGTFREGQIGHLAGEDVPDVTLRTVRAVDWVTFGGVLIRRELIRACGPFDDRYRWAYVMDVDYCFEARLRGFHLFQVPVALQHEENRTTRALWEASPQLRDQITRNYELFYDKWRPFSAVLPSIAS